MNECSMAAIALGPLETTNIVSSSRCIHPVPGRTRRPRRVLYPASQSRRRPLKQFPDLALRWLRFLSVLVFLQIYTEETNTCTVTESPDVSLESDSCRSSEFGWRQDQTWRIQTVSGTSEGQRECVVA